MAQFAAIRRDARVEGLSIRALADKHGVHRRTVRQALESAIPPSRKTPARLRAASPFVRGTKSNFISKRNGTPDARLLATCGEDAS